MKIITLKTLATGIVAGMLLLTSCGKDGATGPQGPAGTNGTNGVANISVQDFTINSWNQTTTGTLYYYTQLNVTALTADVNNNGAVEVFFSTTGGTYWTGLPMTEYVSGGSNYIFNFSTGTNLVEVDWIAASGFVVGNDPNTIFGATIQLKVVVIPPSMRKANPDVNFHNYNEIKKHFKI
jgi:hypothetical protein